eukprot:1151181-Pelagomonas_calceolata.AAC.6
MHKYMYKNKQGKLLPIVGCLRKYNQAFNQEWREGGNNDAFLPSVAQQQQQHSHALARGVPGALAAAEEGAVAAAVATAAAAAAGEDAEPGWRPVWRPGPEEEGQGG